MKKNTHKPTTAPDPFEAIGKNKDSPVYVLRLYVHGMARRSSIAIAAIEEICDRHLHGRFTLEVIDTTKQQHIAMDEDIIAIPMLEKILPLPTRRMIGDFSDEEKVLNLLDLKKPSQLSPSGKS